MIDLGTRLIDEDGNIVYTLAGLRELISTGHPLPDTLLTDATEEVHQFNRSADQLFEPYRLDLDYKPVDINECLEDFTIPNEFFQVDFHAECLAKCSTEEERNRVNEELQLFEEKKLTAVLSVCKYLVQMFEEHDIVTGVGRGSCCASFVLYLLGVHHVDPLRFGIPITEFIRN